MRPVGIRHCHHEQGVGSAKREVLVGKFVRSQEMRPVSLRRMKELLIHGVGMLVD
jgi:hypothetical protein